MAKTSALENENELVVNPPMDDGMDETSRVVRNISLFVSHHINCKQFVEVWGERLGKHFWSKMELKTKTCGSRYEAFTNLVLEFDLSALRDFGNYLNEKYGRK